LHSAFFLISPQFICLILETKQKNPLWLSRQAQKEITKQKQPEPRFRFCLWIFLLDRQNYAADANHARACCLRIIFGYIGKVYHIFFLLSRKIPKFFQNLWYNKNKTQIIAS